MRQVRLGRTDPQISVTAFGGDGSAAGLQESADAIHRALELGITLFG
ncbi:hypothetical protein [Thermoactinospora rubra]|nr:hypothetical protein [Thermoactinospora rubra]